MNIPLTKPYFSQEEEGIVVPVVRSGWVMQGPRVEEFEKKLSIYLEVKHVVAVSSGTAALHLSLIALGIGPGDEVLVPSFTFIASANSVLYVGAKPVFVDINSQTYNIDPQDILKKITKRTKAIIVVHQVGLSADMDPIIKIAKDKKLLIVEDAACSLGAKYKGKLTGTFGDIACFSLHPRKSITTGEGGFIASNNSKVDELLRSLRSHGAVKIKGKETYPYLGYNYRMTDIQAAIGIVQFKKINEILSRRREKAQKYNEAFASSDLISPFVPEGLYHTYQSYLVKLNKGKSFRDRVMNELRKKGISSRPSIMAIHKEHYYRKLFGKISLPRTEDASDRGLIIPLYPQMSEVEQGFVIKNLKELI